ncbi:MAG TPA: hypothetical protein VFQ95_01345 [Rhodanobacteraceae bacterium]|nr:hypothetical protein [Rhodanobacteraceae bacterium]
MRDPRLGWLDSFGFTRHGVVGGCTLAFIVLRWIWPATHTDERIRHLSPRTRAGLPRVVAALRRAVSRQHLPVGSPADEGLVGVVHGPRVLAIGAIAVPGGTFFVRRAPRTSRTAIKETHDIGAVVVWIFWGGRLLATIAHGLLLQSVRHAMPGPRVARGRSAEKPHVGRGA